MAHLKTPTAKLFTTTAALLLCLAGCSTPSAGKSPAATSPQNALVAATYNTSLNRASSGQLIADLRAGDEQARNIAAVIQRNDPDVIILNEFDYDDKLEALEIFRKEYLGAGQRGQSPVDFPYSYSAPVNTGVDSGMDLDGNGSLGDPGDAYGFGKHPGHYGMAILSKYPLDADNARTFQKLLWSDMPGHQIPVEYYESATEGSTKRLRLSSKSHWDVPLQMEGKTVHLLVSHPTPPSFEGPERRNTKRNGDEIRLMADYIAGGERAKWIVDDKGNRGGLKSDEHFIFFGDQNSDPSDGGNSGQAGIGQILGLERVCDPKPTSRGAVKAAEEQTGNAEHKNPHEQDTADFGEPTPGNLRVDYVLPSCSLAVEDSKVFWPTPEEELGELMGPDATSDHHLVWARLRL
ncbi:endonuclease/exonuclease/phosphatase family protein [Trueperella pyogenes]|uniref:endonuclease/exonuclease/phosphatase family protein n=1 Tax=Trueperella pyogenes TaxID=1661 RepID=UPI00057F5301|nr:endonuclease/exonuclease/phosphatase family protein [Trueperella pyogenes]AJC69097.1 endonuclease [Trueperella pyogenes TP8]WHU62014.1 endonuclease/exonuclease/phosphatase family protein [Trueperella pyogenes]